MTLQIGALNSGGSGPRKYRRSVSRLLAGIAALGLIAGLGVVASAPAVAANAADFDPGYIISDAQFYDGNAMTAAEIQAFLESKSGVCQNSMPRTRTSVAIAGACSEHSEAAWVTLRS